MWVLNDTYKRRSKEYKNYLRYVLNEFNTNGKKTVLMTCDTYFPVFDGVINVMDNYARRLAAEMNVLVLVPAFKGTVQMRGYPVLGVKSIYSDKLKYQVALPAFDFRAKRYLKKLKIDIIHCHSPFFIGKLALKIHKKRHIPMVCTFHSQYKRDFIKYIGDNRLANFLLRFIMKVFNGADEVWTMHRKTAEVIRGYGYKGKIRLTPNATAIAPPENYGRERLLARQKYGAGDDPLFIFVGRLITQKNILFIAEVLGELKRRGMRFKMLFAGDGPDRGKLEKKLKEQDVWENVTFAGHISSATELCGVYAAADLFLFPSYYDVSSIVQIEAASRYTPTVFLDDSVTSGTVTPGVNGYSFPNDVAAFADGVCAALADREKLHEVGENAYRDIYVLWEGIIKLILSYYDDILKN